MTQTDGTTLHRFEISGVVPGGSVCVPLHTDGMAIVHAAVTGQVTECPAGL